MADITSIFGGSFLPPSQPQEPAPADLQLLEAIRSAGIEPPDHVTLDGKLHRFKTGGKGHGGGDKSGWYIAFGDGVPAGRYGDWRQGIEQSWRADVGRQYSPAEEMAHIRRMAEAAAARDAERAKLREAVADTVEAIWQGCTAASADHPYLARKGVQPHGARVTGDGRLVVPLYSPDGALSSLQYIAADGGKLYHSGGKTGGCSWVVGVIDGQPQRVYIAEGFATAATVHEEAGAPCFAAYSASNLPAVAEFVRTRYAGAEIVIVADNDASGVGQKYADQCAAKFGCKVIMPPELGDVNDYRSAGGDVRALLTPRQEQAWLIAADDFCSQPAPMGWLVKGWLPDTGLAMVHGPSGGGKTFHVLDWCLRIASGGGEWQGCKVRDKGAVVYLAGEGHHGLRARIAGWKQHHGYGGALAMHISRSGCDLNTPAGYVQALSAIRTTGQRPALIVVDTLHRFLAGDENSAQDAKTMLDACGAMQAEFGCAVMLVHHTGVSDEAQHRARGSSAWRGALDVEISIQPDAGHPGTFAIVQRKMKDAELRKPLHARLETVEIAGWLDEDGEQVTTAVTVEDDAPVNNKPDKKESAIAAHTKKIINVWEASGKEVNENGEPYITRSAVINYLIEHDGKTESTANAYAKPNRDDKLIGALLNAKIIRSYAAGWAVECQATAASMLILR